MDGFAALAGLFSKNPDGDSIARASITASSMTRADTGGASPLAIAFSFSGRHEWISLACSDPVLAAFPPEPADVLEITERMASARAYDDVGDPPSFWDGDVCLSFGALSSLFESHGREIVSHESARGPFVVRWIDEKWLRRSACHSDAPPVPPADAAALAMASAISCGAMHPGRGWQWVECLSRAACSQSSMSALVESMARASWIGPFQDGHPTPLHLFVSSASVAGHGFVAACSALESSFPGSVGVRDEKNRTPLFIINSRLDGFPRHDAETFVAGFSRLCEMGGDPETIVAPLHPRHAANHPGILVMVEEASLSSSVLIPDTVATRHVL